MDEHPIKTPLQLGAVLRGYRHERKATQHDVGARVGIAQNAISQLESDPGPTSFARVLKVLAALDLEMVVRPRDASADQAVEW